MQKRGYVVGNMYFRHTNIQNYTRLSRGQNKVVVIKVIDLGRVMQNYFHDAKTVSNGQK